MKANDEATEASAPAVAALMEQILYEVKKVVVGQDYFLERVLVALLARGHLLVEGVPGLAKTLTVSTLAQAIQPQALMVRREADTSASRKPLPRWRTEGPAGST